MFMFGGRRANVELQLPFIHRILVENRSVEYHLWNLARDPEDREWLQTCFSDMGFDDVSDRVLLMNQFAGDEPWTRFNDVYRYYADARFAECRFVKLDDDVVFIETDRFAEFEADIDANPDRVISANVINNGACTVVDPELTMRWRKMRLPLLNVHLRPQFALMAHQYFFDNYARLLGREPALVPTRDWLSINLIGYDWMMGRKIAKLVGTPSPRVIAGRMFTPRNLIGDEGAVNMQPRLIQKGFMAGHLYFGPQAKRLTDEQLTELREHYAGLGRNYLA